MNIPEKPVFNPLTEDKNTFTIRRLKYLDNIVRRYNDLIRKNDPDTIELREQIHAQIQEIEEAESHVAS